ncbi:hypothetical protein RYX36_013280 [Vicia faba]
MKILYKSVDNASFRERKIMNVIEDDTYYNNIFDDGGSQYSLTGFALPPLGGLGPLKPKLRRFIISPNNYYYRRWQSFLAALVFYSAWVSPFELGFLNEPSMFLSIADNVVNGLFFVDIGLTFFVAYHDKSTYLFEDRFGRIACRYLRSWFLLDVVSSIPYEAVREIIHQNVKTYGYFSLLRLWRLRRVGSMFARLEKDRHYNYFWLRCAKLACVTLFVTHFAACFYFLIADTYVKDRSTTWLALIPDVDNQSTMALYIISLYWSIFTLSSVGYGDVHPVNKWEMLYCFVYCLVNVGFGSYLIGNMTNLVVHSTRRTMKYRDTVQAATKFAHRNRVPVRLEEQMLSHLLMKYKTDLEGVQQQEIIDSLPKAIRSSISYCLFYRLMDGVYLFDGVSKDLIFQLVTEMKAEYIPPKQDVIMENEAPADFYLFVTGGAELIKLENGVENVVGEVNAGELVGEIGVLCYRPHPYTARAKRLSQVLRLSRTVFLNLINSSVGDGTVIMNNFLNHLQASTIPGMDVIFVETQAMLARGKTDLPIGTYFAAIRNDNKMLEWLLRNGSDLTEADRNGRTAMHVATSSGNEHGVTLLLKFGADPNIKDLDGNIPLWEAMIGGHKSVEKILIKYGASLFCAEAGYLAYSAAERNSIELLKELVELGVDVSKPNKHGGSTALHAAVSEGNTEMVRLLLDQGADVDKKDGVGWTPRGLADHQGHEEIILIFQNIKEKKEEVSDVPIPENGTPNVPYRGKFQSQPVMPAVLGSKKSSLLPRPTPVLGSQESLLLSSTHDELPWLDSHRRKRANTFHNSIFGMIAAANRSKKGFKVSESIIANTENVHGLVARVTLSCPEIGEHGGKLSFLPKSLKELLDIGAKKFNISPTKILNKEGALIDDIDLIKDGDHLIIASD